MFDRTLIENQPWLMEPGELQSALARVLRVPTCPDARQLASWRRERLDDAQLAAQRALTGTGLDLPAEAAASKPIRAAPGKVAVIPLLGPVEQRYSSRLAKAGGTSLEEIHVALDAVLADDSVSTIVLDIDSPGGSVYGVEELADKIYSCRERKRTYGIANSMACSAAYWIGTAAETLLVTPGGNVGSVGVYCVHVDESEALKQAGLRLTPVYAGQYKVECAPWSPLGEEARQYLQESVNRTYSRFLDTVARHRGLSKQEVRDNFGQGRTVDAEEAVQRGMADRVLSMDELLGRLLGRKENGGKQGARADHDMQRMRQEVRKRRLDLQGVI